MVRLRTLLSICALVDILAVLKLGTFDISGFYLLSL